MSQSGIGHVQVMAYQVAIRPYTDIRNPAPELLAALGEQFERAEEYAQGRLCVSVPGAVDGDGSRAIVATLLHAAAAHHESAVGAAITVEIAEAYYSDDGCCHVFASSSTAVAEHGADRAEPAAA